VISTGDTWTTPGPCSTPPVDDPGGESTVPATTTSSIRPIGIADLLLVRQEVKRYTMGEIAHVENIMMGETRRRIHRESTKTTETVMVETERVKEESRDLQTTGRFELQQESDAVIKEESSREIALSISASYGPFASGTANITSTHGDSKQTTTKNAMQYAREITDKAVRKVQERVLERRTVTTEHEVVDVSKHGFDNTQGQKHIQGIYRWLDKIYEAQIVSYGLRMMFELVVPEPSAFYRFALGAVPPEGLTLEQPDPPGYCHHPSGTFVPLVPGDVSEANYPFWVSKYTVSGVEPPPPLHRVIGITMAEEPAEGDLFVMSMNNELQVPQGYRAERAWVGGEQALYDTSNPNEFMSFHIGRTPIGVNASGPMNGEDGTIPVVAHGYSVAAMGVTIEVLCTRTAEAFAAWQLATFTSIMGAYNELKSQYDAALSRLK
jgi:3-deoxy-D-arabino-heptulosonate 7-phosphate (DAHP) synthase